MRELCCQLYPAILVSHTVMYYWVRVFTVKRTIIEPLIIKEIQEYLPSCDISSELLQEAETTPPGTREKSYSKNMIRIINWSRIYVRITNPFRDNTILDFGTKPFIYVNRILDILTAYEFL